MPIFLLFYLFPVRAVATLRQSPLFTKAHIDYLGLVFLRSDVNALCHANTLFFFAADNIRIYVRRRKFGHFILTHGDPRAPVFIHDML